VQKQARLFKIDTNSTTFQDIIRRFWMPRLLQKIQESSSSGLFVQDSAIPQPLDNCHQQPPPAAEPPQAIQSLDYHVSESMNMPEICQLSEYPIGPFHAIVNDNDYDPFVKGCYYADNNSYEMEAFHLGSMPALGNFENSTSNSHVAENNWAENDFSGSVRNMDELNFWILFWANPQTVD